MEREPNHISTAVAMMGQPEQRTLRSVLLESAKTLLVLLTVSAVAFVLHYFEFSEPCIISVHILGVLIVAAFTDGQIYGLVASLLSVVFFNFFFTEPYVNFRASRSTIATLGMMLVMAVFTSAMASGIKVHARRTALAQVQAQDASTRANLLRAISHDLRTPLTSISGNASNLLSNGDRLEPETRRQIYSDIYEDAIWLNGLVENILAISRIDEGRIQLRMSTELVDDILGEALHHVHDRGGHHITVEQKDELLLVRVDARLIVQVIVNLIDNAVKYTPPGTAITVGAYRQENSVFITVADEGPGVAEKDRAHVFDMFYSGANRVADSRRSLGLGLSLCRSIISAHGGEITLSENRPHGAVFTIRLPAGEVTLHE